MVPAAGNKDRGQADPIRRNSICRSVVLTTAHVFFALASAGCEPPSVPDESTVTVLVDGDERALGPAVDDSQKLLVFLAMVRGYRENATNRLAERREHSQDYREWTYHLRRDVRWHDGVPVTAHDIAFTLDLFRHPDVLYATSQGLRDIETVTVVDDYVLTVTWKTPSPGGLDGWTQFLPKHLLEDLDPAGFYEWDFWKQPIGNGPYRYVRHVPQTMMELEANPDFYGGRPRIDRVILKFGGANRLTELLSGNVDIAALIDNLDARTLSEDARFRVYYSWAYNEPMAIHWNHRHPLFEDPLVRRALTHAIDRYELRRLLDLPEDVPVMGGLSPWHRTARLHREGKLDPGFPYDPSAARRLLAEAGWVDRDGDGIREREGVVAQFTLLANEGGEISTLDPAVFIQDQLREVGVRMTVQPVARSVVNAAHRNGDFDALISWIPNQPAVLLETGLLDGARIGYRNPELVRLLELLAGEMDAERQDSLYTLVNDILRRDVPFTLLFPLAWSYAAHRRVRGLDNQMHPLEYMEDLWIEKER